MATPKRQSKKKTPAQTKTAAKELVKNDRDRFAIQKSTGEPRRDVRGARPAG